MLNRHMESKKVPKIDPPEHGGETDTGKYLKMVVTWSKGFTWEDNDNDTDNDTLREVPHPSNEGLALQARV